MPLKHDSSGSSPVTSRNVLTHSTATSGAGRLRLRARTLASFQRRAFFAIQGSQASAALTPRTLLAAIEVPVPVQHITTPWAGHGLAARADRHPAGPRLLGLGAADTRGRGGEHRAGLSRLPGDHALDPHRPSWSSLRPGQGPADSPADDPGTAPAQAPGRFQRSATVRRPGRLPHLNPPQALR